MIFFHISPVFQIPANVLKEKINRVVLRQPRITLLDTGLASNKLEYVQRSLIFRFPDVITFEIIPLEDQKSTLAVHSYSVYGAGDLGLLQNITLSPIVLSNKQFFNILSYS